jgi:hypothetical protein
MKKANSVLIILFASLIVMVACNLPFIQGVGPTPSTVMMISVSTATDYRTGPGQSYDVVGVLNPGVEVQAVGRSADGNYLLIRDPANPANLWWLDGQFVTTTGDPTGLAIFTPPPTPTKVGGPALAGGCPTPVGGGPTPVNCPTPVGAPTKVGGCPTPVNGGPTPVSCPTLVGPPAKVGGCPTLVNGGPTPVSCPTFVYGPTKVYVPTKVKSPTKVPAPTKVEGPTLVPTLVK